MRRVFGVLIAFLRRPTSSTARRNRLVIRAISAVIVGGYIGALKLPGLIPDIPAELAAGIGAIVGGAVGGIIVIAVKAHIGHEFVA